MESAMEDVVIAENLTKRFTGARTPALDRLSFSLQPGSIVGLIGRNGAGKTTLLNHISGLMLPSDGRCTTLGRPTGELGPGELLGMGAVTQKTRLLDWMTVRQQLRYVACFYDSWDLELEGRLLRDFELDPDAPLADLPPGKIQSLAILLAICHRPKLLLLDEPVSALDPIAREIALQLFMHLLTEEHTTIIISSHVLSDVETIIDHVLCLHQGKLLVNRPLDDLKETYSEWRFTTDEPLTTELEGEFILEQEASGNHVRLVVETNDESLLSRFQEQVGAKVERRPLNLRQIFFHLIGRER